MRPVRPRRRPEAEPDPYADIADLYDLEHASYDEDIPLYLNLAQVVGDPIVELGCGTGRLLLPLADAGWRVTGADRSAPMLERARHAVLAAGQSERVSLVEADMLSADHVPGGPFGLVILALNGLMHLATAQAQRRALESVRRALDPRGQLVLDIINPSPDVLRAFEHAMTHEGRWTLDAGTIVDKFSARRLLPATQTIETHLWYDRLGPDGVVRRAATSFPLRYIHPAELELMLELAGFAEWQVYGNYDLDPLHDAAERLIVTADVSPSP